MRGLQLQSSTGPLVLVDHSRVRRTLAGSRAVFSVAALALTLSGAPPLDRHAPFVFPLLAAYAAWAVTEVASRRGTLAIRGLSPLATHLIDVSVAAGATLLTSGADGPFFPFLLFPVLAAAY